MESNEDDPDFTILDPRNLLPFECILEPERPEIRIPKQYVPNNPAVGWDNQFLFE